MPSPVSSPAFSLPILSASPTSADSPAAADPARTATPAPEDRLPYDRSMPPARIASEGAAHLFSSAKPHLVVTGQALRGMLGDIPENSPEAATRRAVLQAAGQKRSRSPLQQTLIRQLRQRHEGAQEPAVETPDASAEVPGEDHVGRNTAAVPAASSLLANYEKLRLENQAPFGRLYLRLNNLPDFKDKTPEQKEQLAADALQLFQALEKQTDARGQPVAAVDWLLELCARALGVAVEELPTLSQLTAAQKVAIHAALKPELARLDVLRERPDAIIPIMRCLTEVKLLQRPGDFLPPAEAREHQRMTIGTLWRRIASELTDPELKAALIAWLETTPNASEAAATTTATQKSVFYSAKRIESKATEHNTTLKAWLESIILTILPKEKFARPTPEERQACSNALAQALDLAPTTLSPCAAVIASLTGAQLKWDNAVLEKTTLPDNPLPKTVPWRTLHLRFNEIEGKPTSPANRDAYLALYSASPEARGTKDATNGTPARVFFSAMTLMEALENRTGRNGQPAPMTMKNWLMQLFATALNVETDNLPDLSTLSPGQKRAILRTLQQDAFALKAEPVPKYMSTLYPLIMSMTGVDMWNRK